MSASFKYKAFISYTHDDLEIATWLQEYIESRQIPKRLAIQLGKSDRFIG